MPVRNDLPAFGDLTTVNAARGGQWVTVVGELVGYVDNSAGQLVSLTLEEVRDGKLTRHTVPAEALLSLSWEPS
jgi:hypothetical protein